jgi:hypothetical protein
MRHVSGRRAAAVILVASAIVAFAAPAAGQNATLDSLLLRHRYPLLLGDGRLSGPGAQVLAEAAAGAQFVALGEPHNVKQVPHLTTTLFDLLKERYGFDYVAIEAGPVITRVAASGARRGIADSVYALARRYPNAFAFNTDQELAMIAAVARAAKTSIPPVWGVDQAFGALHVLERLAALAPGVEARRVVERVVEHARPFEATRAPGERRYISRMARSQDLAELRRVFAPAPRTEADMLLRTLETSHRIYQNNIRASPTVLTGYESNREREEYMKQNFMENYRAAVAAGDSLPRVLLKLGHWHTIRGANWGNVHTLGNFVAELARANGRESLHVALYLNNASGDYGVLSQYADYKPFAEAADPSGLVLLDLRPLRPYAAANRIAGLTEEQRRIIFGFDLALLIGGAERGTFTRTLQN